MESRRPLPDSIRAIRERRGWTQETLSELTSAHTKNGVSKRTLQRLESSAHVRPATIDVLECLARTLEVGLDDISEALERSVEDGEDLLTVSRDPFVRPRRYIADTFDEVRVSSEPPRLEAILTGEQFFDVVITVDRHRIAYCRPSSDAEAVLLSRFLEVVQKWGAHQSQPDPSESVGLRHDVSAILQELRDSGILVFGTRWLEHADWKGHDEDFGYREYIAGQYTLHMCLVRRGSPLISECDGKRFIEREELVLEWKQLRERVEAERVRIAVASETVGRPAPPVQATAEARLFNQALASDAHTARRLSSGEELVELAISCHMLEFSYDTPAERGELEAVAAFVEEVERFHRCQGRVTGEADRLRRQFRASEILLDLERFGYWAFGLRLEWKETSPRFAPYIPLSDETRTYVRLLRSTSGEIEFSPEDATARVSMLVRQP